MCISSRIILTLFLLVFVASNIEAKTRQVIVGFPHWPPMKIVEGNSFGGIDAEILRSIEKEINVRFVFKSLPWKRAQEEMRSGDVDLLTSMSISEERKQYAVFIEPPYWVYQVLFYTAPHNKPIDRYEDLAGKSVGQIRGGLYFPRYDEDVKVEKVNVEMEDQLIQMLENKRLDVVIGFETNLDYTMNLLGYNEVFQKSDLRIPTTGAHLAFSKKSKNLDLLQPIKKALMKMVESGEIKDIREKVLMGVIKQEKSDSVPSSK